MFQLFFCSLFAACAPTVYVHSFDSQVREPNTGEFEVFTSPQAVPYCYKEIGLISVEGYSDEPQMIEFSISRTKQLGADGIIILSPNSQFDGNSSSIMARVSAIIKSGEHINPSQPAFVAEEIAKLKKLMDEGVITEQEFKSRKDKLLNH